jgi:hypothetical protein
MDIQDLKTIADIFGSLLLEQLIVVNKNRSLINRLTNDLFSKPLILTDFP